MRKTLGRSLDETTATGRAPHAALRDASEAPETLPTGRIVALSSGSRGRTGPGGSLGRPRARRRRLLPTHVSVLGMAVRTPAVLLAAVEFVLFYVFAQLLTDLTRGVAPSLTLALSDATGLVAAFACTVAAVALGFYSPAVRYRDTHPLGRGLVAFGLLAPTGLYLAGALLPLPTPPLLAMAALAVLATASTHLMRSTVLGLFDEGLFKRRVLVLGAGREARRIGERMRRRADRAGFELVAYVAPTEAHEIPEGESAPVVPLREVNLRSFCRTHDVHEIVVAWDDRRSGSSSGPLPVDALLDCRIAGVDVTELVTFIEREAGRIELDVVRPSWLLFSPGFGQPLRRGAKRLVDLAVTLLLLAVSWPLMLLTEFAIKLEDGWRAPVLYRQERVGLGGRGFEVVKFRSMCTDAERDCGARWAEKNDPRITRVGNVIRLLRIDELPQLWNVLWGEMALVGPRPERPVFVDEFDGTIPFYGERHRVKPGLTGWAQLNYPYGSSPEDARRKLEFDLYYVKNFSLLLDLMVLLRTVEVVLFGRGAR